MKTFKTITFICLSLFMLHCGGSGGTETGTTDAGGIDTSTLGTKVEAVAGALVPSVTGSGTSSSISTRLAYGTTDEFDDYLDETNIYVLSDVFGDPEVEPAVVTKIRVLLDSFGSTVEDIFQSDSDFSCTGRSALSAGDTVEIPFYGNISNGTSDDRYVDCIYSGDEWATLYGQDSGGTVRIIDMDDSTQTNSESTEERGNNVRLRSVIYGTYAEVEAAEEASGVDEGATTIAYLDLQYAQISQYEGEDAAFDTSDDIIFKSRSRITGRVTLDEENNPNIATGDFTVTKYDKGINEGHEWTITTKTIGRGSYGDADYSLLSIDSDMSSLSSSTGIFCIQTDTDLGLPSYADATNCTDLESTYAWGTSTFPFTLSSTIEEVFEDKEFFEGDNIDMISSEGDNFEIPTYDSTEVSSGGEGGGEGE